MNWNEGLRNNGLGISFLRNVYCIPPFMDVDILTCVTTNVYGNFVNFTYVCIYIYIISYIYGIHVHM